MNREVCQHGAPISQHCGRCAINPKSTAGILLREFDGSAANALAYAERRARILVDMGNAFGLDYQQAAEQLRKAL